MTTVPEPSIVAMLQAMTPARVRLGNIGNAPPLEAVLDFQLAHARARDAINNPLDTASVASALAPLDVITVASQATDRSVYLRRPDLGRQLSTESRHALTEMPCDIVFVIADGLSATAVEHHAAAVVHATLARLPGWSTGAAVVASQARVAIGDEIGEAVGAEFCVVLIGERPGLSVSDSLGVYITYHPRIGRADSERNCISNIHTNGGLSPELASAKLTWLLTEARKLKCTGIGLKDEMTEALPGSDLLSLTGPAGD
jgi:ethanolamine ammonia-lyase small subunit